MSPFDYAKSVTHTKESLYTNELIFNKEYVSFMVNRALSNSPQTALFADAINQYQNLDKKLQYDFYMHGIPKQRGFTKWVKKEESEIPQDQLEYVASTLKIGLERALEIYKLIGADAVIADMAKKGGRQK